MYVTKYATSPNKPRSGRIRIKEDSAPKISELLPISIIADIDPIPFPNKGFISNNLIATLNCDILPSTVLPPSSTAKSELNSDKKLIITLGKYTYTPMNTNIKGIIIFKSNICDRP